MTWAKIVAAILGLIKPLLYAIIYWKGEKAGWAAAALARLEEERKRIELAERARRYAENSNEDDPYLRN